MSRPFKTARWATKRFIAAVRAAKASGRTFGEMAFMSGFPVTCVNRLNAILAGQRILTTEEEFVRRLATLIGYDGPVITERKR